VRVNHQSLDSPLVILANQALEIIAAGKSLPRRGAPVGRIHRRGAERAGGRRLRSGNQIGAMSQRNARCYSVTGIGLRVARMKERV
jgi:hypothetical protein